MAEKKKRTPSELWDAIQQAAADDLLEETLAMSDEELDADIRAHGGDPDAIGARGAALAKELIARRKRLAWQEDARRRLEEAWAKANAAAKTPKLPRAELLARIETARRDARFTQPLAAAFRKRGPEASSDDELRALLDEIEMLRAMADDDAT